MTTTATRPRQGAPMEDPDLDVIKDDVRTAVARNLRGARVGAKLSQEAVAAAMNERGFTTWSRVTVSEAERGRRGVLVEELVALSYVLDIRLPKLLQRPAVPAEVVELVEAFGGRIIFEAAPADASADAPAPTVTASGSASSTDQI